MRFSRSFVATVSLVLVTAAWGFTFPLIKNAVSDFPPLSFVAARFFLAALFLAPVVFFRKRRSVPGEWKAGVFLGGVLFLGYAFQTLGLRLTSASNAGFITGAAVVWVPLIAWIVEKTPVRSAALVSIVLSVCGLGMLAQPGQVGLNVGDGWVLLCSLAFALHIVLVGRIAVNFDSARIAWIQIQVCALLAAVSAFFLENQTSDALFEAFSKSQVWFALAFCGLVATSIAYWVQNAAQKYSTAVQTALIFTCEPVFAAIFGYWLNGEALNSSQIAGGALMLAGMICVEVRELFFSEAQR